MTGFNPRDQKIAQAEAAVKSARAQLAEAELLLEEALRPSVKITEPNVTSAIMFRYRTRDGGRLFRCIAVRTRADAWQTIKFPESGVGLTNTSPTTWPKLVEWLTKLHEEKRMESYPFLLASMHSVGTFA